MTGPRTDALSQWQWVFTVAAPLLPDIVTFLLFYPRAYSLVLVPVFHLGAATILYLWLRLENARNLAHDYRSRAISSAVALYLGLLQITKGSPLTPEEFATAHKEAARRAVEEIQ